MGRRDKGRVRAPVTVAAPSGRRSGRRRARRILAGGVLGAFTALGARELRRSGVQVFLERSRRSRRITYLGVRRSLAFLRLRTRRASESEYDEFHLHTAEQVFELLGGMKGAVMKMGQMISFVADSLPETYQASLRGLQQGAPPMAEHLVGDVIEAELGGRPERVFLEFSPEPAAAASIGQVHRARLFDGSQVAVKVQYPGVDVAIRADLDNAYVFYQAARLIAPGIDPKPITDELRERMGEELDYRIEATNQDEFYRAYEGHPWILVPKVHDRFTTPRVLVSDWVEGEGFYDLLDRSQEVRDRAAEQIFRFWIGSISRMHFFNGDPHPGNYYFTRDGRIWFLDYGFTKRFDPEDIERVRDRVRALRTGDKDTIVEMLYRYGWLRPEAQVDLDRVVELSRFVTLPLLEHRDYVYTREYLRDSVSAMFNLEGKYGDVIRQMTIPRDQFVLFRIQVGLGALLARLRAVRNWAAIFDEYFFDAPPSTPLGEEVVGWPKVPAGTGSARR